LGWGAGYGSTRVGDYLRRGFARDSKNGWNDGFSFYPSMPYGARV